MYGIPLKFIFAGGGILIILLGLGLHLRNDNKMREQIISLQVDLRTSETNYTTCENVNRGNVEKFAVQQASIDQFATEKDAAIERNNQMAIQITTERQANAKQSAKFRQQISNALRGNDCAVTVLPSDALILLNNAISRASADKN